MYIPLDAFDGLEGRLKILVIHSKFQLKSKLYDYTGGSLNKPLETQILEAEECLRNAMLNSDVKMLDRLLAPELIFTNHLGQVLSKEDDLIAHQSGMLDIKELTPSERVIKLYQDVAIIFVRVHLVGSYAGITSDSNFRFTRIWTLSSSNTWQVIAAHSTIVT